MTNACSAPPPARTQRPTGRACPARRTAARPCIPARCRTRAHRAAPASGPGCRATTRPRSAPASAGAKPWLWPAPEVGDGQRAAAFGWRAAHHGRGQSADGPQARQWPALWRHEQTQVLGRQRQAGALPLPGCQHVASRRRCAVPALRAPRPARRAADRGRRLPQRASSALPSAVGAPKERSPCTACARRSSVPAVASIGPRAAGANARPPCRCPADPGRARAASKVSRSAIASNNTAIRRCASAHRRPQTTGRAPSARSRQAHLACHPDPAAAVPGRLQWPRREQPRTRAQQGSGGAHRGPRARAP